MTATGYIHYALDKKTKLYRWFWGGAGFDGKYTEINRSIPEKYRLHCGDLFNTTGIETGI
jgi:hypothetical protein